MGFTNFPSSFFDLISLFQKASPVNVNYVTMVSSSSPSTPLWSGNHPPSTLDSDKTISLPSPLQRLLNWYIAVHHHEPPQPDLDEKFYVKFGSSAYVVSRQRLFSLQVEQAKVEFERRVNH
jgi:hypothetical protein